MLVWLNNRTKKNTVIGLNSTFFIDFKGKRGTKLTL